MLTILPVSNNSYTLQSQIKKNDKISQSSPNPIPEAQPAPLSAIYANKNINFKARIVNDIEHEQYIEMSEEEREVCRQKYEDYYKLINIDELYKTDKRDKTWKLPLSGKYDMNNFLKVSADYNKYKDHKIICVGRSPKWFLNASIWMKDGIEDYDFIAFSSNWYERAELRNKQWLSSRRLPPNDDEKKAYKEYLKRKKCYPTDIVKSFNETGKQVIITDYIHSGCGLASFLDLLANFAKEEGILDDFAKSIKLFTLSSMEYLEELGMRNDFMYPTMILPDILKPYKIEQQYHDMASSVMDSILIDKNSNECRSTYYPPRAWLAYNPDKFRTGLVSDEELKKMSKKLRKRTGNEFTDAMKDYRNLLNFRILDGLNERGLLKLKHITK